MFSQVRPAIASFVLLSLVTGVLYPALVTGIAEVAFPRAAGGSLIREGDRVVGSELIGQPFTGDRYFWSRPSATSIPYDASAGSGSNLAPTNPALADAIRTRVAALKAADPTNAAPIPVDLVTASGSGLDPHLSIAAAKYQAARVARARGLPVRRVEQMIDAQTQSRVLGVIGEPVVNVLALNLMLDHPTSATSRQSASSDEEWGDPLLIRWGNPHHAGH